MEPKVKYGVHTWNGQEIEHTDLFHEGGYSRFVGWLSVQECLAKIKKIKAGFYHV